MQEPEPYYDDRLFELGIEFIAWDGAGPTDGRPRRLAVIFAEVVNGRRFEIEDQMIPNADQTEYRPLVISPALWARGIRDIVIRVNRTPPIHSDIFITIEGEANPLRVTKRY